MTRQRTSACIIVAAGTFLCGVVLVAGWFGLRVNSTSSYPPGLWRIEPKSREYLRGDVVFICPPDTEIFRMARQRGYFPRGLCPGWHAPLIKQIAATAGDRVVIGIDVRINGASVAHSRLQTTDAMGRALPRAIGGVISTGQAFLLSTSAHSFDSRYFGSIPAEGILGLAVPVRTYAP